MKISTTQSLLEALDAGGKKPEERGDFDDEVLHQQGANGAVLVTDLSSFTRAIITSRGLPQRFLSRSNHQIKP
jgi:hypothetical protein